jgi:peptide/nickel transport system substrate-binding protein
VRWASTADSSIPLGLPPYLPSALTTLQPPWAECLLIEHTDATIYPFLAKEWDIKQEESKVIFTLRDDVYFSDGSKFNAEAVKWNIDFFIETKLMNPAVTGANVLGEYVVEVTLAGYTNAVLPIFASHSFCMASMEYCMKNGEDKAKENPVGTGAFLVSEHTPGIGIHFSRNDNYWQPGKPYLDTIEFVEMRDLMTQSAAVMSNNPGDRVDSLATTNGEQITLLEQSADVHTVSFITGPMAMFPDSKDPNSPLSKLEVRQALAYAVDRQAICDARGFGIWQPSKAFVPPPYYGNKGDQNFFSYDQAKAKGMLASAGYPNGFTINMYSPPSVDRDMTVALQSMLEQIGIVANLSFPEAGAATELRVNGWDGIYLGAFTSLPSISSTYRLYVDPGYQFYPSLWRPFAEIDSWRELYESSRLTILPLQENYEKMHEALIEYMVVIPLYDLFSSYVINNRVHDSGWGEWGVGTMWLPWDVWVD